MTIDRRISPVIREDLARKIVLLSGPRQCGKTTVVEAITRADGGQYLDWDDPADRRVIGRAALDFDAPLRVHAGKGRERRVEDIGRSRVRQISAARLLANLP